MDQQTEKQTRLLSLDTLRGADMLFIMGFSSWVVTLCALLPDCALFQWIASQMEHVSWNGLKHHDTIFPLFLFIAGISFPFSLAKQQSQGRTSAQIYLKIIRRGFFLVLLGLVCNGLLKFDFANLRWGSVLGRIGLAWMFAALLFTSLRKTSILATISAVILVGYWLAMWLIPGGTDPYSYENNLVGVVDRALMPGRLYENNFFDPEGLLSTLPAIVTAMLGMFTGQWVRQSEGKVSGNRKTLWMILAATALILIGWAWSYTFPINKKLWTSSFVCVVGGYSLMSFALFYYIIDVRGWKRWVFFFQVIGLNSITIFMAPKIIDFSRASRFFFEGTLNLFGGDWKVLMTSTCYILTCWVFLYILYKKKIFLKL